MNRIFTIIKKDKIYYLLISLILLFGIIIRIKAFLIDMNYRRPHLHSDLEIIYVLRGTLALTMDSKTYYVRKNEFIVINAFQLHELATPQQVKLLILQINPKEYETFFPQINEILFQNQVLTNANLTNFGSFKQLFLQTCLVYFQENSFFQLECHGYAALTLFALLEQAPYDVISEKEQNAYNDFVIEKV